jgi:hypothetical protein
MDFLVAHQVVNMFRAAAVALAEQVTERRVVLALNLIFLDQLLCMAAAALDQVAAQVMHRKVAEEMTTHQQLTEVAVDHSRRQIVGWLLQVQQAL